MTEWRAFNDVEPFGGPIDDFRAGLGPAVAINMNRKEGAKTVGPLAFYPWHEETEKQERKGPLVLSVAETAARLRQLLGGRKK